MVLTVEPGLYFNNYQIDKGLANPDQAQYLVKERLENMRTFGGARIEDMVRCNVTFAIRRLHIYHMSRRLRGTQVCRVN
eukprot:COSAG02_NODE_20557_length_825_cov_5.664502_1_plen_79_part_00